MNTDKLSRRDRLDIYRAIEHTGVFEIFRQHQTFASFIASFEDIHGKPSSDPRFNSLFQDIVKHCEDNDDYTSDEVLLSRINVLNDNFEIFLTACLNPQWYATDIEKLDAVKESLEAKLKTYNLILEKSTMPNGETDWKITVGNNKFRLADVNPNEVNIFIDKNPSYPTKRIGNHSEPDKYPALVLAFDRGWDDYSKYLQFDVFYHRSRHEETYIGKTKIIAEDSILDLNRNDTESEFFKITDILGDEDFISLDEGFCSLGQNASYYNRLSMELGSEEKARSLLWGLQDVGLFNTLQEKYEHESLWYYLTRDKSAQHMLRYAEEALQGVEAGGSYGFTYRFKPPFAQYTEYPSGIRMGNHVTFDFDKDNEIPTRLYAIIGKNGCGKTRLLSSIPRSLCWKTPDDFEGKIPRFGKLIAVSNSHYDNFDIPQTRADFNYVYCGLSEMVEGSRQSIGLDKIVDLIIQNCSTDNEEVTRFMLSGMKQIANPSLVTRLFDTIEYESDTTEIRHKLRTLSSGELGMLYLYSSILVNIRYDSLILFDEPENHLHPNSIVQMITLLYEILEKYDSYAIVATHSPIVIQAVRGKNVLVMTRDGQVCAIRKIDRESLGANLSELTDNVFGNMELPRHYRKLINELLEYRTPNEVEEMLQSDNHPLSLPMQMYLNAKKLELMKQTAE